jgi:hypothetical protein
MGGPLPAAYAQHRVDKKQATGMWAIAGASGDASGALPRCLACSWSDSGLARITQQPHGAAVTALERPNQQSRSVQDGVSRRQR